MVPGCCGNKEVRIHCLTGHNVALYFFSFSQLQLKNLHEDLSGRLEESLSIISEKVPFNDTSRYYVQFSIVSNFEPLYGNELIKIIFNLCGKKLHCLNTRWLPFCFFDQLWPSYFLGRLTPKSAFLEKA